MSKSVVLTTIDRWLTCAMVRSGHQLRMSSSFRKASTRPSYPSGSGASSGAASSNQALQARSLWATCASRLVKGCRDESCTKLSHVMSRIQRRGLASTEFRSRDAPPESEYNGHYLTYHLILYHLSCSVSASKKHKVKKKALQTSAKKVSQIWKIKDGKKDWDMGTKVQLCAVTEAHRSSWNDIYMHLPSFEITV